MSKNKIDKKVDEAIKDAEYSEVDDTCEVVIEEEKKETKKINKKTKALFISRFFSYIVDFAVITILASYISTPFLNENNINKLDNQVSQIQDKYYDSEMTINEYFNEVSSISYDLAKESMPTTIVAMIVAILYYIVLQYYTKGVTLGRLLTHTRLESDDGELSINQLVFRSLLMNFIGLYIIILASFLLLNKKSFIVINYAFEIVVYSFMFISAIFVIARSDGKGLHDMLCKTQVVRAKEN